MRVPLPQPRRSSSAASRAGSLPRARGVRGQPLRHPALRDRPHPRRRAARRSSRSSWPARGPCARDVPEAASIFIAPPSLAELGRRLERRATDTEGEIAARLRDQPRRARGDGRVRPRHRQRRGRARRPSSSPRPSPRSPGRPRMAEVLLGVSGGIAAYKADRRHAHPPARRATGSRVVMTRAARRFVGPATFAALSGRPVGPRPVRRRGAPGLRPPRPGAPAPT